MVIFSTLMGNLDTKKIKSTVSWHTSEGGGSWPGCITLWCCVHPGISMLLHIQAFVNIYLYFKLHKHWPKSDKVIIGERIFWLKSVRRDPWSPMHINILVDSSFGRFYPHFKFHWVRLAEKWRSYHQRKHFFDQNQSGVTRGHPCISVF